MCDRCAALEDEVAYLRIRLGDRLNEDLLRVLIDSFGFAPTEARLVAVLYQARGIVGYYDLEIAIKTDPTVDYADIDTIKVFVNRIRKKTNFDFLTTYRALGMALSQEGRRLVAAAVEEDRRVVSPEAMPLPAQTDSVALRWNSSERRKLHRLLRMEGRSYEEAAKMMKTTRGSIASAAMRFGFQTKARAEAGGLVE